MDRTTGMDTVWELVGRHNLRLVLLSDEAVDVSMHCSFYIGIFDADGLLWSDWQRSQYLRAAHANYTGLEQDKDATAASVRTNGIETELIKSAEGEVWVTGEGPIGTAFSSEHGIYGGEGRVSWVRLSPEKVLIALLTV